MECTKWDIVAGTLLLVGAGLLFAAAGTSDVKSIVGPADAGFASDRTELVLIIAGCISAAAGVLVLIKKGGGDHAPKRGKGRIRKF